MDKKTPLYDRHVALGGKMVPFGGYIMPVQYGKGIIAEHMAVREKAGLFDVSHMGEVIFEGPGALASLNHLITNGIQKSFKKPSKAAKKSPSLHPTWYAIISAAVLVNNPNHP